MLNVWPFWPRMAGLKGLMLEEIASTSLVVCGTSPCSGVANGTGASVDGVSDEFYPHGP